MPELPEVETVRSGLEKLIINKTIKDVKVYCPKIIKNVSVQDFCKALEKQTFTKIRRKGKYLFLDLNDYTLVSHLRMEGKYNYYQDSSKINKHDHIIFYFTDNTLLTYNDTRQFGTMELVTYQAENSLKSVKKLGLEPFDPQISAQYLYDKAVKKTINIKKFLLDQSIMCGLGNIYVDEVLFATKINPLTSVKALKLKDYQNILDASKKILTKAIKLGGTTVHSFMATGNISGKFQNELNVYGRNNQHCYRCNTLIKKIVVGGRGTHYCPHCQGEINDNSR